MVAQDFVGYFQKSNSTVYFYFQAFNLEIDNLGRFRDPKISGFFSKKHSGLETTQIRPCQILFLFSVICVLTKKPGSLNLFIQKLAHRSFLFIIGKKRTLFIYFNFNHFLSE